jgi:glycosyltransferase involved in cell wall biosynthesis
MCPLGLFGLSGLKNVKDGRKINMAVVTGMPSTIRAFLMPQIRAAKGAGYRVISICSNGPDVGYLRDQGVAIQTVPILRQINLWQDLKSLVQLALIFRRERIDVVHTHTPKGNLLAQIAAWLAGVPIRFETIHGLYFYGKKGRLATWLLKKMEYLPARLATHVFCVSREDIDFLTGSGILPAEKLQWLTVGVDTVRFDPARFSAEQRLEIRAELGIPEDVFVVGIVSRMVRGKGFQDLFEAFAQVRRSVPRACLLVVGEMDRSRGQHISPKPANLCGAADDCRCVGQRYDVDRMLAAMDVYCLPSYREGYPVSVMEASSMALPAVVSDIRGCREAVVDGQTGLVVPVKSPANLAEAIEKLAKDPALRRRMGQAARQRALDVFDVRRIVETLVDRYQATVREVL